MDEFNLNRAETIFFLVGIALFSWALFDTERLLRFLSLNRKNTFSPFELLAIRVPSVIVLMGAALLILDSLMRRFR
jgi:hypothetical protein